MKVCQKCRMLFSNNTDLNEHNRENHANTPFECPTCGRNIQRADNLERHIVSCEKKSAPICSICKKKLTDFHSLRLHIKEQHKKCLAKKCRSCGARFTSPSDLDEHMYTVHATSARASLPEPDTLHFNDASLEIPEKLVKVYSRYWSAIRTSYVFGSLTNSYNFRLTEPYDNASVRNLVVKVYLHQSGIFKLNIGLGLILVHKPTGVFRYFHAGHNNKVFTSPELIAKREHLSDVLQKLDSFDPFTHGELSRPDTTHAIYAVTNVFISTAHVENSVPVGGSAEIVNDEVVNYLATSRHILWMMKDKHGRKYKDNLCFFRCLSSELDGVNYPSDVKVIQYYQAWLSYQKDRGINCNLNHWKMFPGVSIKELPQLEDCFEMNINVYSIDGFESHTNEVIATTLFKSAKLYKQTLFLNLYKAHFSRIIQIEKFARCWICKECDSVFRNRRLYGLHIRTCEGKQRKVYPGGGFGLPLNVFDKLTDEGFTITDRFFPYFVVYDFECRFTPAPTNLNGIKLVYEKELIPVSVSVCSNIPGFTEPHCIIRESPADLISDFLAYIDEASTRSLAQVNEKFIHISEHLSEQTEKLYDLKAELNEIMKRSGNETETKELRSRINDSQRWENLEIDWKVWCRQTPIVGFNSAKFDINLIRTHLVPVLLQNYGGISSCITKNSAYTSIATDKFLFLDVMNFLAAGTSYKKWLSGFGVEEEKGIFPYEWLTDYQKLFTTKLPHLTDFYSTLKQEQITDDQYSYLQNIWKENNFKTMFDFLEWYNNLDVVPFVTALEKMRNIFVSMNIDLLKQGCISLPGLAMTHMFNALDPDIFFQLFDNKTKEYHSLVQQNIVGGPSIIFNRCSMVGSGSIKKSGSTPKAIEGRDCNGLYLYAFGKPMPAGFACIWEPIRDTGVTVPIRGNYDDAKRTLQDIQRNMDIEYFKHQTGYGFDELAYVLFTFKKLQETSRHKITLRHQWNGGQKIFHIDGSTLPVDGWIPELGIILQYNGCYYHGHDCYLTKNCDKAELNQRAQNTKRVEQLLNRNGNIVVVMTECDFQEHKLTNKELQSYLRALRLKSTHKQSLKMSDIIRLILNEKFFGMVEVDIQVPFWNPTLRKSMEEFPPIFKNVSISLQDIGETMKGFAKEHNLLSTPRRALISSFHGTKLLLPTPLLKWYIEHGLLITRIYKGVEYSPKKAFTHLVDEVTRHRESADNDPTYKAYGETFKLLGNSYYGKCLTNIEKHKDVKYGDRAVASKMINNWRFRSLQQVSNDCYEIQMAKKTLVYKLPVNIAFFVYGYAKLRMLEFYHDFLAKVLPETGFELLEMDTDSLYFSLSKPTLEETVCHTKRGIYNQLKHEFLVLSEKDNRKPGLFKLEWHGIAMICLSSKTYIAYNVEMNSDGESKFSNIKISTKGVSKKTSSIGVEEFEMALHEREMVEGVNRGFRMKEGRLHQYVQRRNALSFFYIKRIVEPDGIHTLPLDL